jgi:hypothetical protein
MMPQGPGRKGWAPPDDDDPDDELLEVTPKEVVEGLGFDPLEFEEAKEDD